MSEQTENTQLLFGKALIIITFLLIFSSKQHEEYGCRNSISNIASIETQSLKNLTAIPPKTVLLPDAGWFTNFFQYFVLSPLPGKNLQIITTNKDANLVLYIRKIKYLKIKPDLIFEEFLYLNSARTKEHPLIS